jgi:8-oxo-dGTP pyrophosphatase MutT (NUDIX family)
MDRPEEWKTVSKEQIADCRVFKVTERHSKADGGIEASFFVIESPDWVNIIPVTDGGELVLIEQYRHGTEEVTLEIPGGLIDKGETPEQCAARELIEETGYIPARLIPLGRSRPNPAIQSNWIYHFAAEGCVESGERSFDEHESIAVRKVPLETVEDLVTSGEISHSLVLAGLLKYGLYRERSKNYAYES